LCLKAIYSFRLPSEISTIEDKINKKFKFNKELNKWRLIRNEIANKNLKIDVDIADQAKKFFDNYSRKLDEKFND